MVIQSCDSPASWETERWSIPRGIPTKSVGTINHILEKT